MCELCVPVVTAELPRVCGHIWAALGLGSHQPMVLSVFPGARNHLSSPVTVLIHREAWYQHPYTINNVQECFACLFVHCLIAC